jgi:hypothetical protein
VSNKKIVDGLGEKNGVGQMWKWFFPFLCMKAKG